MSSLIDALNAARGLEANRDLPTVAAWTVSWVRDRPVVEGMLWDVDEAAAIYQICTWAEHLDAATHMDGPVKSATGMYRGVAVIIRATVGGERRE